MPTLAFADGHAAAGNPVYCYRLDWETKGLMSRLGATHSVDLPLLFEDFLKPFRSAYLGVLPDARRHALAERMREHWLAFVRGASPKADWPAYRGSERLTKVFGESDRVLSDPEAVRRITWQGVDGYAI